jgi:farnesyl diphosphate synthase
LTDLNTAMASTARKVNDLLTSLIPRTDTPENRLYDAMRYSAMAGGKRLRPFLVMQGAALFNVAESCALRAAAAVEMVHTYSLIHDDLPAMDNADLRRGKPTCHKQYDEATAVLAGDALLTLAFGVLGDAKTHGDPQVRCDLIATLAHAAGALGMCGGQQFDLMAEKMKLDIGAITRLQRLKTGELIAWSCEAGAILGKQPQEIRHRLQLYAHDLGLAFQIADDLLDAEGSEAVVGKSVGRDADAGKATFVSILGIDRARAQAALLADQAAKHLDLFGEKGKLLQDAARFVVERRN